MLKLFGGKPDHPMADPKEVRRILDDLPSLDPHKALDELSHWHESVSAVEGFRFEQRLGLHLQIDEAAQPRVRRLSRDYFAATRPSRFQETRLWTVIHGYWQQAGLAYAKVVDSLIQSPKAGDSVKTQIPLLYVRTLRSLAQRIKWMHLRYGPIDMAVWGILNNVYSLAEARKLADTKVAVYPNSAEATPRDEFVRALLFSASSPNSLLPVEIEIAERVIGECVSRVTLSNAPGKEFSYWIDLTQAMGPLRLTKPPAPTPGLRFLATGAALETLAETERKLRSAVAGAPAGADGREDPETALDVTQHLALYWSPEPPERKSPRHAVKSRLTVVAGFEAVLHALDANASRSLNFDANAGESWIVENVSAGGFGAAVPQLKGDWLKIGALLALQPEGGSNWLIGTVRRVNKVGGQQARVGIQTLSRAPLAGIFRLAGSGAEEAGIALPSGDSSSAEIRLVLRPGVFAPAQNLESERDGRMHVYMPLGIAERGDDYEILRFREMVREG